MKPGKFYATFYDGVDYEEGCFNSEAGAKIAATRRGYDNVEIHTSAGEPRFFVRDTDGWRVVEEGAFDDHAWSRPVGQINATGEVE